MELLWNDVRLTNTNTRLCKIGCCTQYIIIYYKWFIHNSVFLYPSSHDFSYLRLNSTLLNIYPHEFSIDTVLIFLDSLLLSFQLKYTDVPTVILPNNTTPFLHFKYYSTILDFIPLINLRKWNHSSNSTFRPKKNFLNTYFTLIFKITGHKSRTPINHNPWKNYLTSFRKADITVTRLRISHTLPTYEHLFLRKPLLTLLLAIQL